jgi:hypothetical protein
MARIFQDIARRGRDIGMYHPQMFGRAKEWFRKQAQAVQDIDTDALLRERSPRLLNGLSGESIGSMILFTYDPKWKEKLPYWDMHPLVLPFHLDGNGFKGYNLHYVSPFVRARILDGLYRIAERQQGDIVRSLPINYQYLKGLTQFAPLKPCIHSYLWGHVRSRFMLIRPEEWDTAVFLPTQQFVGGNPHKVYHDSRRKY